MQTASPFRVRSPREFYGGLALVALAAFAFWAARDLTGMEYGSLGPGSAPRLYASLLALLGIAICLSGLQGAPVSAERFGWRGLAAVVVAIVCFAAVVRPLGLVTASFCTFLIGALGSKETRWLEAVVTATVLTASCVVLFVTLLNLPFRLWPVLA